MYSKFVVTRGKEGKKNEEFGIKKYALLKQGTIFNIITYKGNESGKE